MGVGSGGVVETAFHESYQGYSNLIHDVSLDHRKNSLFITLSVITFDVAFNACDNA